MSAELSPVRGRFAPTPSGEMHIGNAWTALLAWLQVRKAGGTMILRIEDLDPERCHSKYVQLIREDLAWLGLDWDEGPGKEGNYGPYIQSARKTLYREVLDSLKKEGCLYPCFCSRSDIHLAAQAPHGLNKNLKYPGTCRFLQPAETQARISSGERYSLRFHLPPERIEFVDQVFGSYCSDPDPGDFIVFRSDGVFAYQLAVVADDANMRISHVLRGADLLDATVYQVAIYRALGYPQPLFAHVPLIIGADGRRLCKRHGDITLGALRQRGVRPEKILGLLGYWAHFLPKPEPVKAQDLVPLLNFNVIPKSHIIWNPNELFS